MKYLPEILFTRIYLGEKCKCAVFLKKNWLLIDYENLMEPLKWTPENNGKQNLVKIKL